MPFVSHSDTRTYAPMGTWFTIDSMVKEKNIMNENAINI